MANISNPIVLAIVGDRRYTNDKQFAEEVQRWMSTNERLIDKIVSGGCTGADTLARKYAEAHAIAFQEFPPDGARYGDRAYRVRNQQIVDAATHLLAFVAPASRGTLMTLNMASKKGIPCHRVNVQC